MEFIGGPADGLSVRVEAKDLKPDAQIDILGGTYRMALEKDLGCEWRAVYVTAPTEPAAPR